MPWPFSSKPFPKRELKPVVADAETAFARHDETFIAGLTLRPGKTLTRALYEQGEAELITAVEAVGWRFAESRMSDPYTIEFLSVR
jgi:hypothetical protein